ncbi:carbonic anhydrase [Tomitella biformata]|uniref:carbonic anhydrase n=1 Tax=Tomitella biformata TaxID=630403 RepID=UPI0004645AEC|nr:carbonic anhydrase [Tomitella biformata]
MPASPAERPSPLQILWTENPGAARAAQPTTPEEAIAVLNKGSHGFSRLGQEPLQLRVDREAFGYPPEDDPDGVLDQQPFAAVLSCSDARVPIELTLGCATNDLFVVRVAGNVPGSDCRGSMHYAASHLPSVRVFAVVGHSRCGANSAAVDAMLHPERYLEIASDAPLRGIIDSLLAGVHFAERALLHAHGPDAARSPDYRARLVTLTTFANTALTALVLEREIKRPCAFGVYKLATRTVGVRRAAGWMDGLAMAPKDDAELIALVTNSARSLSL